ncbi:acetyltransferase [Paenibacillus sp. FSL W7-1287]|uniref:acetyltransferase n=1 Tax=Paenibacillus sp. FSL W7-1287 TaxID=2954538 RepID=UPI0030FC0163
MNQNLIIIGAGGHGKVAADIAMKMKKWDRISFLDDNVSKKEALGIPIIDTITNWPEYEQQCDFFVAIGNNTIRKNIMTQLEGNKASIATLIHPSAIIGEQVLIEYGTVVMAGSVINSCTKIAKGCIINTSSSIDHDNNIGEYVHISPGVHIAGNVNIGALSWLGIGSTVINDVEIASNCTIGAGAVVINTINEQGTYLGIPAVLHKK